MTQLAQSVPIAADHTAEIARLNDAARAGSLPTSRTVFTRALADILAGDAEDVGTRQASLMLGQAALRRLIGALFCRKEAHHMIARRVVNGAIMRTHRDQGGAHAVFA